MSLDNDFERESQVFKALAHPARLQIVSALADGPVCVNDLREIVGSDVSTVSKHISVLKNAGIVKGDKRGQNVYYEIVLTCVIGFIKCIDLRFDAAGGECSCVGQGE